MYSKEQETGGVSNKYPYSHRARRPRRRCPVCHRIVAVDALGLLARHGAEHAELGECVGSGGVA